MPERTAKDYQSIVDGNDAATIAHDLRRHMVSALGADPSRPRPRQVYHALALAVRDRLVDAWIQTQRAYYEEQVKRVYYLSMEFLPGRLLRNALVNLGILPACREALASLGMSFEEIEELEWDPGLGNGGLGRLASCYLSALASLRYPAYGYGIRYDYGIFHQRIINGWQVERPDNWLRLGTPWGFERPHHLFEVRFGGRTHHRTDAEGRLRVDWVDAANVMAMASDILVPGYRNGNAVNMRLWSARSSRELELDYFNSGDYVAAIQDKVASENISKVLYPSESVRQGRELRLKQEYFFVAATFQDILRRFAKRHLPFDRLPEHAAVQLNDTHPAIAVAELMRLLVDGERMHWEPAWDITVRTCGYTNHTVLPEALESWPVELLQHLLPRHLEIIYEINQRLLREVEVRFPGDVDRLRRMSLVAENGERRVRMANLAVAGSHAVNGVSALHGRILREDVLRDFDALYPGRIGAVTNGIDHRRFLLQANPDLADLITSRIGAAWVDDATLLVALEPFADDRAFKTAWRAVRRTNKERLAACLAHHHRIELPLDTMLDVHVKRMHEYKRQLLNVLHALTLYLRIRDGQPPAVPRTILFAGKAAPGYAMAKLVIKLVHAAAELIAGEPATSGRLRVAFVPNYTVTLAEKLAPATDLSEQISTAGTEASGTGNMKFAMNGALLIGTADGATVEIGEAIGVENLFLFGHDADAARRLRAGAHDPHARVEEDAELRRVLALLGDGTLSPGEPGLFHPILENLLAHGDPFLVTADYRSYVDCQGRVAAAYLDQDGWTRRSILSVARMGRFSADRSVREYAERIWGAVPLGQPREAATPA